jgi:hypothetical protein
MLIQKYLYSAECVEGKSPNFAQMEFYEVGFGRMWGAQEGSLTVIGGSAALT